MKKRIFSLVAIAAISFGAWNYSENQSNVEISDLALANVEALAYGEEDDLIYNCYWYSGEYCYYTIVYPDGNTMWSHWNMKNKIH